MPINEEDGEYTGKTNASGSAHLTHRRVLLHDSGLAHPFDDSRHCANSPLDRSAPGCPAARVAAECRPPAAAVQTEWIGGRQILAMEQTPPEGNRP